MDCSLWTDPLDCSLHAPLSLGFSRQEYWSGLPCPPPGDLPDPGVEPRSLMSPAVAGGFFIISATWEVQRSLLKSGYFQENSIFFFPVREKDNQLCYISPSVMVNCLCPLVWAMMDSDVWSGMPGVSVRVFFG